MQWDKERFRRMFPNLYREISESDTKISISINYRRGEDPWRGYEPSPEDFIARASTPEEAEEVIEYLERTGRISREKAEELRNKLRQKGLEGFGERRTPGYYFRKIASKSTKDGELGEAEEKDMHI
ncbi:hypothetical protein ATG_17800 [Desulfurococcaceae archaeon AG1]|jgi:hypothetical protein|nr:MAG: DUF2095 domain-containing protein [Desulfurococcaceae archaeon]GAY26576.1 hypothetical protein ATG_17800 [Desulfurococcaceae archaeon AG1]